MALAFRLVVVSLFVLVLALQLVNRGPHQLAIDAVHTFVTYCAPVLLGTESQLDSCLTLIARVKQGVPEDIGEHCKRFGKYNESDMLVLRKDAHGDYIARLITGAVLTPHVDDVHFPGSVWLTPPGVTTSSAVILYFHGGGAVKYSPRFDSGLAFEIGRRAGVQVLSVAYPLAPEHPAPRAGQLAAKVIDAQWQQKKQIFLVGESGGGYPILQALINVPGVASKVSGVALLSPMVSGRPDLPSHTNNAQSDVLLNEQMLRCCMDASYPDGKHTLLDVEWPVAQLPPIFVQAVQGEMLLDDALQVKQRAGNRVTLDIIQKGMHVMPIFWRFCEECSHALTRAADFIGHLVVEKSP